MSAYLYTQDYADRMTAEVIELQSKVNELEASLADKWISVEDRLPEGDCLVFIPSDNTLKMHTATYHPNITTIGGLFEFDREPVTNWQPLPPKPTNKET